MSSQKSIDSRFHHDYIPDKPIDVAIEDIGEMTDRQNTIFFVSLVTCLSAIITVVMISNNRT